MKALSVQVMSLDEARENVKYCNSYSRLPHLISFACRMDYTQWLSLLGEEWSSCDNVGQYADMLIDETPFGDLLDMPTLGKWMMTDDERRDLAALPETLTIYRGCYALNKWGLSWTMDIEAARKFPFLNRYQQGGQALIVTAQIRRSEIIALKNDRNECEVICYRPKHISTKHLAPSA